MAYTKRDIIDILNQSDKIDKVSDIRIHNDKFQNGILGNLKKVELLYRDSLLKPSYVIYKNQACSDTLREAKIYNLLKNKKILFIPQKICDFENGDIIIDYLANCKSGDIQEGCNVATAEVILDGIVKIHSTFWDDKKKYQ